MNLFLKDLIQITTSLIVPIGGVIAAFKAVTELRRGNKERAEAIRERREQFRWQQAEMARTILDQTWSDSLSKSAMRMLDWSGLKYEFTGRFTEPITHENVHNALRVTDTIFTDDELFVRSCFDQLFDHLEGIEHYLNIGLVNWEDVRGRLEYYIALLSRNKPIYEKFLTTYQFKLALSLLNRFPQWSTA